jgi:hypothetical protein
LAFSIACFWDSLPETPWTVLLDILGGVASAVGLGNEDFSKNEVMGEQFIDG